MHIYVYMYYRYIDTVAEEGSNDMTLSFLRHSNALWSLLQSSWLGTVCLIKSCGCKGGSFKLVKEGGCM